MSECPTCGKVLNTLRGMRQHHTKAHGESLPNRTCRGCGEDFYDPKADRAFCEDCDAQEGEHNGNWKDAKERTQCKLCDGELEYYPSDKKGIYCPDCIEQADGLLPEGPDLRVDRVDIDCIGCGKALTVLPSELRRKTYGKFCSLDCYGEWLSENVVGENHHQWEGGTIPYGEGWWTVRRKARERDNHTCQICAATEDSSDRKLDVHHITPVREFADPSDAHSLDNVITLCRSCHRHVEIGSLQIRPLEE